MKIEDKWKYDNARVGSDSKIISCARNCCCCCLCPRTAFDLMVKTFQLWLSVLFSDKISRTSISTIFVLFVRFGSEEFGYYFLQVEQPYRSSLMYWSFKWIETILTLMWLHFRDVIFKMCSDPFLKGILIQFNCYGL